MRWCHAPCPVTGHVPDPPSAAGNVKLHGATYDEAAAEAMRLVEEEGRTLIHPFDDPHVIAGQGTIAMEILKQMTGRLAHRL